MRYEFTTFQDGLNILADLFPRVQSESGIVGHSLSLRHDMYVAIDQHNLGFGLIAYDGQKPVGFVATLVMPYQQTNELHAACDVIYVLPEYRDQSVAGQLIVRAEREAKRRGCVFYVWSAREDSPLSQVFLKRVPIEKRYRKFIREL